MNTKIILLQIIILFFGISLRAKKEDHVHLVDKLAYKLKNILDGKVKDANEWTYYYQFVGPDIKKDAPDVDKLILGKIKNQPLYYEYGRKFIALIRYLYITPEKYRMKPNKESVKQLINYATELEKKSENKSNDSFYSLYTLVVGGRFPKHPQGVMLVFAKKGSPVYMINFFTAMKAFQTAFSWYFNKYIEVIELKYTPKGKITGIDGVVLKVDDKLRKITDGIWKNLNIGMIPKDGFSIGHNNFYFMPVGMMKGLMPPVEYIIERKKSEVATIKENRKTQVLDKIEDLKAIKKENGVISYKQRKELKALEEDYEKNCIPYIKEKEEELKKLIEKYKDQLPKKK